MEQSSLAERSKLPFLDLVKDDTHRPNPRSLPSHDPSSAGNQPLPYDAIQSASQHEHINFLRSSVADIVGHVENIHIHASSNILGACDDLADFYDQQLELSARRDFLRAAILRLELRLQIEDPSTDGCEGVGTDTRLAPRRDYLQSSTTGADSQGQESQSVGEDPAHRSH